MFQTLNNYILRLVHRIYSVVSAPTADNNCNQNCNIVD